MIKSFLVLFGSLLIGTITMAQSKDPLLEKNYSFSGASATKKSYHAIYQLDSNEPKVIEKALRNINNVLQDPGGFCRRYRSLYEGQQIRERAESPGSKGRDRGAMRQYIEGKKDQPRSII
jgi:hypothetical protein